MAYPFPATYQPIYPQYQQPNYSAMSQQGVQQAQQQVSNGLIWIQGIEAAKSYMVAPNTTVALWDSESETVYLKSADASGMPSMRILDYTIRENAPTSHKKGLNTDFATKEDISIIQNQINEIRANISAGKAVHDESVIPAT